MIFKRAPDVSPNNIGGAFMSFDDVRDLPYPPNAW